MRTNNMEQKRVSFKVAKAIKEAGYPQGNKNSGNCPVYPLEDHDENYTPYTRIGKITTRYKCETWRILSSIPYVVAPTYLDVWLWLWREKKFAIPADYFGYDNNYWSSCIPISGDRFEFFEPLHDPEDAIIAAIEYIIDKNLLSI